MIAIPWIHLPAASKLKVALQGNPSPTSSLRTLSKLRVARCRQTGTLTGCPVNAQWNNAIVSDILLNSFPDNIIFVFPFFVLE